MSQIRENTGTLRQRFSPRPADLSLWDSSADWPVPDPVPDPDPDPDPDNVTKTGPE